MMSFNSLNNNENDLTGMLVHDLLKEKRSERRWRNFRFLCWFTVVIVIGYFIFSTHSVTAPDESKGYVALVRLSGMIAPGEDFSAESVLPILKEAFQDKDSKGVILEINSGGGTPVQAAIIHDEITYLKNKYKKKVIVIGEDMLASGAYYVAVAGDKIYVNPNTLTGSIGVIMKGFGFPDLIKKVGVERRVYTSGANKDRLDPFLPQTAEDLKKISQVIDEVHDNFRQAVIKGRGNRLQGNPTDLFSGDFWSGTGALKLGLVDGLGNLTDVMETEYDVNHYKEYGSAATLFKSMLGHMGASMSMFFNQPRMGLWSSIQ